MEIFKLNKSAKTKQIMVSDEIHKLLTIEKEAMIKFHEEHSDEDETINPTFDDVIRNLFNVIDELAKDVDRLSVAFDTMDNAFWELKIKKRDR